MPMGPEETFLALSGIQHFAFCRRQWALIHLEQAWAENYLTATGRVMHQRAHDETSRERRGDLLIVRGLAVHSNRLWISGKCDVVEFHQDDGGCVLAGEGGRWRAVPVEYKRGKSKSNDADRLQLCAQAMCLEEMLCSDVSVGYLFYGKTRSREMVRFSKDLRDAVTDLAAEMHVLFSRGHTPSPKPSRACRSCSLSDVCLPSSLSKRSVAEYVDEYLTGDGV